MSLYNDKCTGNKGSTKKGYKREEKKEQGQAPKVNDYGQGNLVIMVNKKTKAKFRALILSHLYFLCSSVKTQGFLNPEQAPNTCNRRNL